MGVIVRGILMQPQHEIWARGGGETDAAWLSWRVRVAAEDQGTVFTYEQMNATNLALERTPSDSGPVSRRGEVRDNKDFVCNKESQDLELHGTEDGETETLD